VLPALTHLTNAWAALYANSAPLRTGVGFAHIAGLVGGGGSAIVEDRGILRAARRGDEIARLHQLHRLRGVHRGVIIGLVVVIASGVLLLASDLETYLHSWVFWVKMVAVAVLLANGGLMIWAGHRADGGHPRGWAWLARASIASLTLWSITTLLGAALPNV
jgi:hypothetical protein